MLRKEEAPGCSVQRKRMRSAARKTSQRLLRILVLIYHHPARFQDASGSVRPFFGGGERLFPFARVGFLLLKPRSAFCFFAIPV